MVCHLSSKMCNIVFGMPEQHCDSVYLLYHQTQPSHYHTYSTLGRAGSGDAAGDRRWGGLGLVMQ